MTEIYIPDGDVFLRPYSLRELFERVGWGDIAEAAEKRANSSQVGKPIRFRAELSTPVKGGELCVALTHDMIFHYKGHALHQHFNVSVYEERKKAFGTKINPIALMTAYDRGTIGNLKTIKIDKLEFPALAQGVKTDNILAIQILDCLKGARESLEKGQTLAFPCLDESEEGAILKINDIEERRYEIGYYE